MVVLIIIVKPKLFLHVHPISCMERVSKTQSYKKFRIKWICFSCGRKLKSRIALYAHLRHCYWYSQFKDHIEDAPFFRKIPSRQLRYYYRNRPKINKERNSLRRLERNVKKSGNSRAKLTKLPRTLK